jgi:release factor glutamine methyltransferase
MGNKMNIYDLLIKGIELLKQKRIQDSAIQARVLLCYILKIDSVNLIINYNLEVQKIDEDQFISYIYKLIDGKPLQYLTNKQEFMKLEFYVDENVLIPQPDTEILVESIIKYSEKIKSKMEVLDLCTGSGAIAVSIAKYVDGSNITASDISNKAIQIAKLNAEKNLVHKKIDFIESDMFNKVNNKKFDIIVSNPPYIKTKVIKTLSPQVKEEPIIALDGGRDGLEFYKIIAKKGIAYLNEKGKLFLEIGFDQKEEVVKILEETQYYDNIESIKDFAGNDRVIICSKKE